MTLAPQVAQRQEALKQLERLPYDVLSRMLRDLQAELEQERHAFFEEQKELERVQRRLAKLTRDLETAQRQREKEFQQASRGADAAARTSRLLRAARRRGQEYEEAIARTLSEIQQLRQYSCEGTSSPTSVSVDSANMDVSSLHSSAQPPANGSVGERGPPTSARKSSRAAAAARAANEEQQHSVLLHALRRRVSDVERENRMLRSNIDILNCGNASSVTLYHELEFLDPSRGM
ncbi:hypothetical protein LSCM1_02412 [Leishmania martiniquensis]|uniref:Uncharacterized protein n=1 Tax=Leishmania martiniquensis TaxID=1580590 RepID=A0A836FSI7_9TRYP|nr:hypothetical protein LSCM1_02412 [Leishmania martiniquensis]